jgi:hypothetical protein
MIVRWVGGHVMWIWGEEKCIMGIGGMPEGKKQRARLAVDWRILKWIVQKYEVGWVVMD